MKETILEEERVLPVLAVRGLVVFPGMIVQFDIGRKNSVLAAKAALDTDSRELFIVTQTDLSESEPMAEDLYKIGVIVRIKQVVHTADNGIKLHVEGIERAEIMSVVQNEPYLTGSVCVCKPIAARHTARTEALSRIAQERFEEYIRWFRQVPPDICSALCSRRTAVIWPTLSQRTSRSISSRSSASSTSSTRKSVLQKLNDILSDEIKVLSLEREISQKAQEQMDENQRVYMLREQMRAIASELGEEDNPQEESDEFRQRIEKINLPPGSRAKSS